MYYNETFFNKAGIKVISVAKEDLSEFNGGAEDARGNTKAELGLTDVVKEKGYFVDSSNQKWFNNQIPMSWGEVIEISNAIQNVIVDGSPETENFKTFFTEWWFSYGWSVGGDCIQFIEDDDPAYNGGYYDFTLMDATKNYIVADDNEDGFTINGNTYSAGEIISYTDKLVDTKATEKVIRSEILTAKNEGKLNELPSQRDAFVEFVRLAQPTEQEVLADKNNTEKTDELYDNYNGDYGYGVSPSPDAIDGDTAKAKAFASGKIAIVADGRWSVVYHRKNTDKTYAWDVAPLPMYKEYDSEGCSRFINAPDKPSFDV